MKFFLGVAQACIIGLLAWLVMSVAQLKTDVAVLKYGMGLKDTADVSTRLNAAKNL